MRRAFFYIFFLMLLTSCQGKNEFTSEAPLPIGRGILNGTTTTQNEYPSVGLVRGPDFICTGTLISSDVVLTAAHCTDDENGNLVALKFTLDSKYSSSSSNFVQVTSIRRNTTRDMALLKLATPITTVRPSELALSAVTNSQLNRMVNIVGYGNSATTFVGGTQQDSGAGTKRKGQSLLFKFADSNYSLVSKPSTSQQVICPGDSGGPLYFTSNGREQLFGVANSVLWRGHCNTVSEAYHAHVSYLDGKTWLLNNLGYVYKKQSIYRGYDSRGNYRFTSQKGEGSPQYTYPGTLGVFKLLDTPANFSNAKCAIPLVRCRNSNGMNYLVTNSCGTDAFETLLGYACDGYRNSGSPTNSFDLYRINNSVTGASISTSLTEAQSIVNQNPNWRLIGFQGVYVLSP